MKFHVSKSLKFFMTLKGDAKFKRKVIRGLKNDVNNLVNFHASSQKSENLHFDELLLSEAYKLLDKEVRKSYVLWHRRVRKVWKKADSCFQKWQDEFDEF